MLIDFNSSYTDPILYYLVLIAENGDGRVTFVLRTDFTPPNITLIDPPSFVTSDESFTLKSTITDISEITDIEFYMSKDGKQKWKVSDSLPVGSGSLTVTRGGWSYRGIHPK